MHIPFFIVNSSCNNILTFLLIQGETDIEQLAIVLGTLGTPNEESWPGLKELPDYNKIGFSHSKPKSWCVILPAADAITLNLISKILIYDGVRRLTAKQVSSKYFEKNICQVSKRFYIRGMSEKYHTFEHKFIPECYVLLGLYTSSIAVPNTWMGQIPRNKY